MKRGEVWTVAGARDYGGKPRPVVIAQGDRFDATASVTVCAFTSDPTAAPLIRLAVEPTAERLEHGFAVDGRYDPPLLQILPRDGAFQQ